jgi:hypothetical protein
MNNNQQPDVSNAEVAASPSLTGVSFRGNQFPNGDRIDGNTKIECLIVDKRTNPWTFVARGTGEGKGEFSIPILTPYTRAQLNGTQTDIGMYPAGNDKWDVTVAVELKFSDGTFANVPFGKLLFGNQDGYTHQHQRGIAGL